MTPYSVSDPLLATVENVVTTAFTTTGRPFLTLFLLVFVPSLLVQYFAWTGSPILDLELGGGHALILSGLGVLALLEHLFGSSDMVQEIVSGENGPALDAFKGLAVFSTLAYAELATATEPIPDPTETGAIGFIAGAATFVGGLGLHVGVSFTRSQLLILVRDLGFAGFASWLETLGTLGIVVLLLFAPFLALVVTIVLALGGLASLGIYKLVERRLDQQRRRSCPSCGHLARKEASWCPSCGAPLTVERLLAPPAAV